MFSSVTTRCSRLAALSALFVSSVVAFACSASVRYTPTAKYTEVPQENLATVNFALQTLKCLDEGDGAGSAEPYLFTLFFKVDGTTTSLESNAKLNGSVVVSTTSGRHNNVGNHDVDAGKTMTIPAALDAATMQVQRIPVAPGLNRAYIPGVAGAIALILEEDNVSDSGAIAGYQAFAAWVRYEINALIPTLGVLHSEVTDADVATMKKEIQDGVETAIQKKQGPFQNVWSYLEKDDMIGFKVWTFDQDQASQPLQVRWDTTSPFFIVDDGIWELTGAVEILPLLITPPHLH